MQFKRHIWTIVLLTAGAVLNGQDETFTARAPATVRAGEQFQYVIEGSSRGDITLPSLDGFQLLAGPFSSYSSHSQWVNGKMTMETVVTYTYMLRATRQGEMTIPPSKIRAGRKEFSTNEVRVTVQPGNAPPPDPAASDSRADASKDAGETGATDPVFLRVIPSRREVFVGEQFVSALKVYTRVNTRPASSSGDLPYEGFYKKSLDPDESAQREEINGQQYITQVIQRHLLIPQKTGEIRIEPYESEWMVPQQVQRRRSNSPIDAFFDDPFFGGGVREVPTNIATRSVTIRVKPLPPGAPQGFTGGVGEFSMKAELSANEIEVNEALSLKVTLRGTGNLPLLGEPEVNLPLDHDVYDVTRTLNTSTSGNRINGSVVFEYPIVARHAGKFRIAPILFAWFDPESREYKSAETEEFNFTVLKGESEQGTGPVFVPGVMHESVEDIGTDIRDIVRGSPLLSPVLYTLFGQRWYRLMYLLAALLTLLTILMIRIVSRRNADLSLVRNRQANRSARTRLKKAEKFRKSGDEDRFYEEVGKAIWGYMADKLNIETSGLSRDVILHDLEERGVGQDMLAEFSRILDESEFSRFAPSSERSNIDMLYRDAVILIRNLENTL